MRNPEIKGVGYAKNRPKASDDKKRAGIVPRMQASTQESLRVPMPESWTTSGATKMAASDTESQTQNSHPEEVG